ncbi:hypothetical protein PCC9214_05548 [Planktothrix tepida]|uniref:DUF1822 family protein n=1 Tax=Planktothrix tepida PCC 9214 TaxID=671072 RepID=A0A1J1LTD2_9CYAN|nr:DUF1822 family protein [Planktothrix tepida]CAD5989355.1 hypothetical protein PCC9214_05548 [Planktothrix tepida]CUR35470.1 conserved hypothetical protein [Planktothrix tepida PCC 9214]
MFTVQDLIGLHPNQIWLEFTDKQRETAWQNSRSFSHPFSQWNAYLNQLVLNTIIPGLQQELDLNPVIWKSDSLATFWEILNGTKLLIENRSLVIIPSETLDTEEFRVPQEWVDIPSWKANYYLAVQVYPDNGYLHLWGYTTHEQLKNQGVYDELERVYVLPKADMIDDLSVLMVAQDLCEEETVFVPILPNLTAIQTQQLLEQLSLKTIEIPRLAVPFVQWAALIENDDVREQLYQRRCSPIITQIQQTISHLSQWLEGFIASEWQDMAIFLQQNRMAFRGVFRTVRTEIDPEQVRQWVEILQGNSGEGRWKIAAQNLRDVTPGNQQVIAALVEVLGKTTDDETRWTVAETLWTLDPENPVSRIRKVKDLGMEINGESVALMVAVLPKQDNRLAVFIRLYPMGNQLFLPPQIQLRVLEETGEIFLSAEAREQDNFIQLKLGGSRGERFNVEVKFGENQITEGFII